MKKIISILGVSVALFFALSAFLEKDQQYKCMIQLTNYTGEGAYIVVSLLDSEGKYQKTLQVLGDDDEWYYELSDWWKFYGKKRINIDGITSATISGGERVVKILSINDNLLNKGYKLRFETAVEEKGYYPDDVEFELTREALSGKHKGRGFVRYVRFVPN